MWENFIDRLEDDETVRAELDATDLRASLRELAAFSLNGREIRNAISLARQLAKAEGKLVDFECLRKVIKVQMRFDEYLKDMNEGLDDDEIAREGGKR